MNKKLENLPQPEVGDIWRYNCNDPIYNDHWLFLEVIDRKEGGYLVYNLTHGIYEKLSVHIEYEEDLWVKVA